MSLQLTMGLSGPASLLYNGTEMLYAPANTPYVVEMYGRGLIGDGKFRENQWLGNTPVSVSVTSNTATLLFDWGYVDVKYMIDGDRFVMHVTVKNETGNMVFDRYRIFALALKFPQVPADTTNAAAFNTDGPSSVFRSYGSGAADLVNEEAKGALGLGWWQVNSPPDDKWFVQMFADPFQKINPNWPSVVRPVAPSESVTFKISIRFGGADATEEQLAGDVFEEYRNAFPMVIPPEEVLFPIARLSFNGAFRPSFATNPRGWFNDASLDIYSKDGLERFRSGLLSAADSSVNEMERVGAAGGIIWDIEGQQLDQSYIGDPSQAEILAPELIGVLDEFVGKIRKAGFPVGFTLRPQTFTVKLGVINVEGKQVAWHEGAKFSLKWAQDRAGGALAFATNNWRIASVEDDEHLTLMNDAGSHETVEYFYARQINVDHFAEMRRKVQYCRRRWGATLFYVDSTLGWYGNLTPGEAFEKLTEEYRDVSFFPEWKGTRHYASTRPWTDTNLGYIFPPAQTLLTYPDAAGLIRVGNDQTIDAQRDDLTRAVREGNILLFDGWYPHHANDVVKEIYDEVTA